MLENNLPKSDKDIVVGRIPIEITIADEGLMPLSIILPSLEDILEMKVLKPCRVRIAHLIGCLNTR